MPFTVGGDYDIWNYPGSKFLVSYMEKLQKLARNENINVSFVFWLKALQIDTKYDKIMFTLSHNIHGLA